MRIYHFVTSINNTNIADKIAKQVWYTPKTLQDALKRALNLEAGLHLAKGVHLGRSFQVMQVSTGVSCHQDGLEGCVHQANVRDSQGWSNACWRCGGLCHFQKYYKATLNFQCGDKDDLSLSDTNRTISQMSNTLITCIADLTFKAILKKLVSLVIGNRKTFHSKCQSKLKNVSQPSMSGASPTATPVMTTVTSTSLPQTMSILPPSMISSRSTSLPVNPGRGPPQN